MSERNLTPAEAKAEAAKTQAQAEDLLASVAERAAAARKNDAEAKKFAAEARHYELMGDHAAQLVEQARLGVQESEADLRAQLIMTARLEREERAILASNYHHGRFNFSGPIDEDHVAYWIHEMTVWSRNHPEGDIEIVINSEGGGIFHGFALIDFILDLRSKGHKVTTLALGMTASMAASVLQAGSVRAMGSNAMLLIHEASFVLHGSTGAAEDQMKLVGKLHDRIFGMFAERAKSINPKTTTAFLRKQAKRTDWWIDSTEALALGLVDEVR